MKEANRHENRAFVIQFNGEAWEIDGAWVDSSGKVAWYDGRTKRCDTTFYRIFSPGEVIRGELVEYSEA